MANLGLDSNGTSQRLFWNLVAPNGIRHSRLSLDSRVHLACTAIRGVVHGSPQGSIRCHASPDLEMAAAAPFAGMSAWCCGLRGRSVLVADVARTVASGSRFCSLRLACIGSRNDQASSVPPRVKTGPSKRGETAKCFRFHPVTLVSRFRSSRPMRGFRRRQMTASYAFPVGGGVVPDEALRIRQRKKMSATTKNPIHMRLSSPACP